MIFTRTPDVPTLGDYHLYRDTYLRPDFQYRCAYCLMTEGLFLAQGGGEIDHHRPLNPPAGSGLDFRHLKNAYSNLYWTCGRCNTEKGNTWPSEAEYEAGLRFLDPCAEDHQDHWETLVDGTLVPKTSVGQYTVTHIRLDRHFLNTMRQRYLERRQKVARAAQILIGFDLSQEEQAVLAELLESDFLLNPPAFVE